MRAVARGRRSRLRPRSVPRPCPGGPCARGPAGGMAAAPPRAEDRPRLEHQLLLSCAQRDAAGQAGLRPRPQPRLEPRLEPRLLIHKKEKRIRRADEARPAQHGPVRDARWTSGTLSPPCVCCAGFTAVRKRFDSAPDNAQAPGPPRPRPRCATVDSCCHRRSAKARGCLRTQRPLGASRQVNCQAGSSERGPTSAVDTEVAPRPALVRGNRRTAGD